MSKGCRASSTHRIRGGHMTRRTLFAVVAMIALAGCTPSSPEQSVVDDAAEALGGKARVQAARTLVLEGEGTNFNLGQDVVPGASGQTFTVTAYRRLVDL